MAALPQAAGKGGTNPCGVSTSAGLASNPTIVVGYHSDSVTFITEDENLKALNKRIAVYNSKIKNKHGLGKIIGQAS